MSIATDGLPDGTRVSCPTAPWRKRASMNPNRTQPITVHVVSFTEPDRYLPLALCGIDFVLEPSASDGDAPRCSRCIARLTAHGLWPL